MSALPLATYECFAEFLQDRIASQQHLTEDSVRYSFFLAVTKTTSIQQHELVLELPHPRFPGKEIDTFIAASDGRPDLYFEFKFHRSSKSTSPKPQKAGGLFKDISRLASLVGRDRHCLVIYLTCPEMARYFEKNQLAYSGFWNQPAGGQFIYDETFISKTTNTFRKINGEHHCAQVHIEFSGSLLNNYQLRVLDVREI